MVRKKKKKKSFSSQFVVRVLTRNLDQLFCMSIFLRRCFGLFQRSLKPKTSESTITGQEIIDTLDFSSRREQKSAQF